MAENRKPAIVLVDDEEMILRYARNYLDYTQSYLSERRFEAHRPGISTNE